MPHCKLSFQGKHPGAMGRGLPCSAGRCGVATMIRSRCCFILIRVTLTQRGVIVQLRGVKPVRNCPPHGAHVCPLRS